MRRGNSQWLRWNTSRITDNTQKILSVGHATKQVSNPVVLCLEQIGQHFSLTPRGLFKRANFNYRILVDLSPAHSRQMSVFGRHADKNATNYITTTSVKFTGPENAGVEYPPVLWFRALVLFRSMMSSCSAGRQLLLTLKR